MASEKLAIGQCPAERRQVFHPVNGKSFADNRKTPDDSCSDQKTPPETNLFMDISAVYIPFPSAAAAEYAII